MVVEYSCEGIERGKRIESHKFNESRHRDQPRTSLFKISMIEASNESKRMKIITFETIKNHDLKILYKTHPGCNLAPSVNSRQAEKHEIESTKIVQLWD